MDDAWSRVDAAMVAARAPPNAATMEAIWRMAFNVWAESFAFDFRPVLQSMHTCSKEACAIDAVLVEYMLCAPEPTDVSRGLSHSILHLCVRVKRDGVLLIQESLEDDGVHTGPRTRCAGADHAVALEARDCIGRGEVDNLFVCSSTGHMHICAPETCPYGVSFSDMHGDTVCQITGRVLDSHKMVSVYWTPAATPMSNGDTFGGDTERKSSWAGGGRYGHASRSVIEADALYVDDMSSSKTRAVDADAAIERARATWRCRPVKRRPYIKYLMSATVCVSILFSRERYVIDMRSANNSLRLANREVYKYHRANKSADAVSLFVVQTHALRHRNVSHYLDLPADERKMFTLSYARRCVALWYLIRTRTKRGESDPNLFPIVEFVVAAMYIFANGVYLPPEVTRGAGEQLLDKDPILERCMPRYNIIDCLGYNRDAVTGVKKEIIQAIIGAVRDENVDPKTLRPSSVALDNLDEEIFRPLRKNTPAAGKRK